MDCKKFLKFIFLRLELIEEEINKFKKKYHYAEGAPTENEYIIYGEHFKLALAKTAYRYLVEECLLSKENIVTQEVQDMLYEYDSIYLSSYV